MIKFEDIQKANETIKTMAITRWDKKKNVEVSKDYAEVNQRIKAFRMCFPNGTIVTDIVDHNDGIVLMKAVIKDEDGKVLATGYAQEDKKSSVINNTSYIENAETSAIGRALGICGFGIDTSVASYEEVKNAQAIQDNDKSAQVKSLYTEAEINDMCQRMGKTFESWTDKELDKAIALRGKKNG